MFTEYKKSLCMFTDFEQKLHMFTYYKQRLTEDYWLWTKATRLLAIRKFTYVYWVEEKVTHVYGLWTKVTYVYLL